MRRAYFCRSTHLRPGPERSRLGLGPEHGQLAVFPGTMTRLTVCEVLAADSTSSQMNSRDPPPKGKKIFTPCSEHGLTVIPPIGPRQLLPLPAATHVLAGGQHTPFPQSTGTRTPQLCLSSKSNPSARTSSSCHRLSMSIFVQMTGSVSTWGKNLQSHGNECMREV